MRLDLREIINIPGASVAFDYELDLSDSITGFVKSIKIPSKAVGTVRNSAGVLELEADVDAVLQCGCARCLKEFDKPIHLNTQTLLSDGEQEQVEPDSYLLEGDCVNVDEIIKTDFILCLDQRFLCSDDCKGLCEKCGSDLNEGPCSCKLETDPRLAVLEQLLENDQSEGT